MKLSEDYTRYHLFNRLEQEIARQDAKWGEQNWPLIAGNEDDRESFRQGYAKTADMIKDRMSIYVKQGYTHEIGWDDILKEEVYEALSAETEEHQILELIHVAAVALQTIASIKRNQENAKR